MSWDRDKSKSASDMFHWGKLQRSEVACAALLHSQAFPTFFLSSLGPRFLTEFYRAFTCDAQAVSTVVKSENRIIGVAVGTVQPQGFYKRLLKRRWPWFVIFSFPAVARQPAIALRLLRAVSYRGDPPAGPERALLSSIALAPSFRGQGLGKLLLRAWAQEAARQGAVGAYLTTDAVRNDAVNKFYRSCGWTIESSYRTHEGRLMNRYMIDFRQEN